MTVMTTDLSRLYAAATRLAVLTTTNGVTHAIADALALLVERLFQMTWFKTLLPATVLVALLVIAGPVAAHPAAREVTFTEGGLTADQAAMRARSVSPAVWRKVAELEAAASSVSAAEQLRIPQLTAKLSYTRLSAVDEPSALGAGFVFPAALLDMYDAQAQLVVPLSDHVLRYPTLIRAARLGKRAATLGTWASEADAANQGRHAYYEWVRARLQLEIGSRQLAQVRANLGQLRALVNVQRIARAELLRVESQEAEAEQTYDRLRELAALREEMLRLQIGATGDEPLAIGEDLRADVAAPASAPLDDLVATATLRRLEVRALELGVAGNQQRREAERANLLPRLSAFAATDYANPNLRVVPQANAFSWSWSAGVQLTWSLPDALTSRTTTRRLVAESAALRADREALVRGAQIELLSAQQGVLLARQALSTSSKGLIAAEESYRVRSALLAAERATAVELVDAQTDLTRAQIAALDARVDLRIAIAELDHALGTDTNH
ncbi:hypothetical protein BH11MYX3_BH11MYX3_41530 [soil metagenome]